MDLAVLMVEVIGMRKRTKVTFESYHTLIE